MNHKDGHAYSPLFALVEHECGYVHSQDEKIEVSRTRQLLGDVLRQEREHRILRGANEVRQVALSKVFFGVVGPNQSLRTEKERQQNNISADESKSGERHETGTRQALKRIQSSDHTSVSATSPIRFRRLGR